MDIANNNTAKNIAIVGFGPKGLFAFERLLAQYQFQKRNDKINITIFNSNAFFGAGDIYRTDQKEFLLMNISNKNINLWTDEAPKAIVPNTMTFSEWLFNKKMYSADNIQNQYIQRNLVGEYLIDGFENLMKYKHENITIDLIENEVTEIVRNNKQYSIILKNPIDSTIGNKLYDKIMLTTGHKGSGANFEGNSNNRLIDFVFPTQFKLNHIKGNSTVAIKGFGLTFIDAVLELTIGKGGFFLNNEKDELIYNKSGKEPNKIYVYSRNGFPMVPKNKEPICDSDKLYYFTENNLSKLSKPYNFETDLLPLIQKEYTYNYYQAAFKNKNLNLSFYDNYALVTNQINEFHNKFKDEDTFNWNQIIFPIDFKIICHEEILKYMYFLKSEFENDSKLSPIYNAFYTWNKISPLFNQIYKFGGLDSMSHFLFDSRYYHTFFRTSYGPPKENFDKIIALAEAGILEFKVAKDLESEIIDDKVIIKDDKNSLEVDYLIDARIPRKNKDKDSLNDKMILNGIASKYFNDLYAPGCFSIDNYGRLKDDSGNVNYDITIYGKPTDGITYHNDTLSRTRNDFASTWASNLFKKDSQ